MWKNRSVNMFLAIKAFVHCNSAGGAGVVGKIYNICIQHSCVTYPEPCHFSAINDKRL